MVDEESTDAPNVFVTKYDYCTCGHQFRYHDTDMDHWVKTAKIKTSCKHCGCAKMKVDLARRQDSIAAANDMLRRAKA